MAGLNDLKVRFIGLPQGNLCLLQVAGLIIFSACSTTAIQIKSSPSDAEVYVKPMGKGEVQRLGTTPLISSSAQLEKANAGSGPVLLELKKDGYQTYRTLITETQNVDLALNLELLPITGLEDHEKLNSLLDRVFQGQQLARRGNLNEALTQLKTVEKEAPQLAATYEIEGGIFYLQKKYREALNAYSQALKYNPKNIESIRMRSLLEKSLGISPSKPTLPEKQKQPRTSSNTQTRTNPAGKPGKAGAQGGNT